MKESDSVFSVMEKSDLTSLEIFNNRKKNRFILRGMREWDDNVRWDRYMVDFTSEDILTDDYKAVGTAELEATFDELGLKDYLEHIEHLLREGKHDGIKFYHNRRKNIRVMYCKHANALGIRNKKQAIRIGASRRHELDEPEIDVIVDGLNLSRAMSYKNAICNLPFGGSKTVLQCDEISLDDFETIGFLAYTTDANRTITGPDMKLEPEMADIIREKYTRNYSDGRRSKIGPGGYKTAYGEYLAIREACDFIYGSKDLSHKRIAVQGLGEVGYPLAEHLLGDKAKLIVTDIDKSKVDRLQGRWDRDSLLYVEPEDIYSVDADIFSPCAMGGVITEERIKKFNFRIIMGSANNQLKATSKDEELRLAKKLEEAHILFVADWVHNGAGVIGAVIGWELDEEFTFEKIKPHIKQVCQDNFRGILEESKRRGLTPTELAYQLVEESVYSGTPISELIMSM